MSEETDKIEAANLAHFLENGPGLDAGYSTFIIARDPKRSRVLVGGLGGMGVGQMWFDETDGDKSKPGYAEAVLVDDADERLTVKASLMAEMKHLQQRRQ